MPKAIIKLLIIILIGYAIGLSVYQRKTITQNRILKSRLENLNEMNTRAKAELDRLNSERAKLEEEAERLKKDSLAYLKQQSVLQEELEKQKKELIAQESKIDKLSKELEQAKQEALKLKQEQQKLGYKKESELKQKEEEITRLNSELAQLKVTLNKKEALFRYNLGVIYTENGHYDEAVDEYEKALKLNPNLSQVHYNLGIIYSDYFNDPQKAVYHYQQYLRLEPNALDAEEVKSWISELQ
jgi:tetratricopeptide (TPR) repeat protein